VFWLLGEGTVAGRQWQLAYEIIPSSSPENDSNEAFCTDASIDGTVTDIAGGCSSTRPFSQVRFGFAYMSGGDLANTPLIVNYGGAEPGTTSVGLEWADGTKQVSAVQYVEGNPMAAVAFDPARPPSYLLEFGSYGEYRIPLTKIHTKPSTWTFTWPN
jgi:hypothetical protein